MDGDGTYQTRRKEGEIHEGDRHLGIWNDRIREFSSCYVEVGTHSDSISVKIGRSLLHTRVLIKISTVL